MVGLEGSETIEAGTTTLDHETDFKVVGEVQIDSAGLTEVREDVSPGKIPKPLIRIEVDVLNVTNLAIWQGTAERVLTDSTTIAVVTRTGDRFLTADNMYILTMMYMYTATLLLVLQISNCMTMVQEMPFTPRTMFHTIARKIRISDIPS